jgi:hypothetical protein
MNSNRQTTAIGEQAVDDDGQPFFAIAIVAVMSQGAFVTLVETATDIVEDDTTFLEVACGEFLLDGLLACDKPGWCLEPYVLE